MDSAATSDRLDRGAAFEAVSRVRYVERALAQLWQHGLVPGEMHLGIGEEAAVVGVCLHLRPGDATATDHRSTGVLVARGVDVQPLLGEAVGDAGGLHRGRGGHMHLFAPGLPSSSDGIVGSAGPYACGYALAATRRDTGGIAVAFFGEGAANQGMLLESWNLAVAWRLPVLFVCKDSGWAITTRSRAVTGGSLVQRARGFGLRTSDVGGTDVRQVHHAAGDLLRQVRGGHPAFLRVRVRHPYGHFLGDPLLRLLDHPVRDGVPMTAGLPAAATDRAGATTTARARGLGVMSARVAAAAAQRARPGRDPVAVARAGLPDEVATAIDARVRREVVDALSATLHDSGVIR